MKTFSVKLIDKTRFEVKADFMTSSIYVSGRGAVYFWIRGPRWYSRRQCVGVLDWAAAISVGVIESSADIAKELGVQI
jgi:hypothetical protein